MTRKLTPRTLAAMKACESRAQYARVNLIVSIYGYDGTACARLVDSGRDEAGGRFREFVVDEVASSGRVDRDAIKSFCKANGIAIWSR